MASRPHLAQCLFRYSHRDRRARDDVEVRIQEAMISLCRYRQTQGRVASSHHEFELEALPKSATSLQAPQSEKFVKQVWDLLERQSPQTRAIYFAYRSGLSYAEIAQCMNISNITIAQHVATALLLIMEEIPSKESATG